MKLTRFSGIYKQKNGDSYICSVLENEKGLKFYIHFTKTNTYYISTIHHPVMEGPRWAQIKWPLEDEHYSDLEPEFDFVISYLNSVYSDFYDCKTTWFEIQKLALLEYKALKLNENI